MIGFVSFIQVSQKAFRVISTEIRIVLIVTGVISGLVVLLSFFDSISLVVSPMCISILQSGEECSLCGMTRSFIAISNFDFISAWQFNRGGIALYSIFITNAMYATVQIFMAITKQKTRG